MLSIDPTWRIRRSPLSLPTDEVHAWCAALSAPDAHVHDLRTLLSADETERADRFHFDKDRRYFIVARGVLRRLLGAYLGIPAHHVRFVYNRYGKPALAATGQPPLHFNVSHSGELALYVFAWQRAVGIDIEQMRTNVHVEQIARRFFSPHEAAALQALPPALRPIGFYNCWTRKEAYIKAHGKGLSLPLDSFDVSLAPGEPARILAVRHADDSPDNAGPNDSTQSSQRWTVRALPVHADYAAALVVEGAHWRLRCWQWPPMNP